MSSKTKHELKIPDSRTARFVINCLKESGIDTWELNLLYTDLRSMEKRINELLRYHQHRKDDLQIESLKRRLALHMLPKLHFSWLNDNPRAVYWVWGKLFFRKENKILSESIVALQKNNILTVGMLPVEEPIPSHSSRLNAIILLLDTESGLSIDEKIKILSDFYNIWMKSISSKKVLNWLDVKNVDMCAWAYNYIKNYRAEMEIPSDESMAIESVRNVFNSEMVPLDSFGICNEIPIPGSHEETVHAIFFLYDFWKAPAERKKLFLIEINKAWNQKKVRDSRRGKKTLNTYIGLDTKTKLDFLADKYNMKINQLIEMLIADRYNDERN